jgi:hypothetical protein
MNTAALISRRDAIVAKIEAARTHGNWQELSDADVALALRNDLPGKPCSITVRIVK